MSFQAIKNTGLCILLFILLSVAFFGYRQSRRSAAIFKFYINHYKPLEVSVDQTEYLLKEAREAFISYANRETISRKDIMSPLNRLGQEASKHAADMGPAHPLRQALDAALDASREALNKYFKAEQNGCKQPQCGELSAAVKKSFGEIRKHLSLMRPSSDDSKAPESWRFLKTSANLLRLIGTNFDTYDNRDRIEIDEILAPMGLAINNLKQLEKSPLAAKSAAPLKNLLEMALKAKTAVLQYKRDETAPGMSSSTMDSLKFLKESIYSTQKQIDSLFEETNDAIRGDLQIAQETEIAAADQDAKWFLALAIAGFVCALAVSIALSKYLTDRVETLLRGARQFADGNLSFRIKVGADDQLGEMAKAFNQMAEQLLARERERTLLATAVDQSADAIAILDSSQTIQYVNRAFERMTGYAGKETVGTKAGDENGLSSSQNFLEALKRGQPWSGRLKNNRKDGSTYDEDCTISPVFNAEANGGGNLVVAKRNITRELQLEKQMRQAEKMQAIGVLAGGIAHDFNNLLVPITGYSEMLQKKAAPGSAEHRRLSRIIEAARRAKNLVQQLVEFSRPKEEQRISLDLAPLVRETLEFIQGSIPSGVRVDLRIAPDAPKVLADPNQIHQIIVNLANNAMHAMSDGGGVLTIELEPSQIDDENFLKQYPELQETPCARLVVRDSGTGMPPEITERIFEPFFTTKEVGEGSGLGLSVIHGIVENYGGKVTVESVPGKGAAFAVYLPATSQDAETPAVECDKAPQGKLERILLVDDDPFVREAIQEMLTSLNYDVTLASEGTEALELLSVSGKNFDALLSDEAMPGMSGTELAKIATSSNPGLPVILCTGFSEKADETSTKEAGICATIKKPCDINEIAMVLKKIFNGADKAIYH